MFVQTADQVPFNDLTFDYPEDEDGLGFAVVRLPSQVLVAIIDDPENLIKGAVLYRVGNVDEQAILREFLEVFNITASDIKWVAGQPTALDS